MEYNGILGHYWSVPITIICTNNCLVHQSELYKMTQGIKKNLVKYKKLG